MKKLSQENDSQSSGEEDDDDGFEILTAENLFSTLLQRVFCFSFKRIEYVLNIFFVVFLLRSRLGARFDTSYECR